VLLTNGESFTGFRFIYRSVSESSWRGFGKRGRRFGHAVQKSERYPRVAGTSDVRPKVSLFDRACESGCKSALLTNGQRQSQWWCGRENPASTMRGRRMGAV
jgi:hypothetical protein